MWAELKRFREEYLNLKLDKNINYSTFSMISIVWNSTKIEGCSLDENDTRLLLDKNITAKGKPLSDHLMVKDHFEAFRFIKQEAGKKRKITQDFLKEVAWQVMKNTGGINQTAMGEFDTSKGDFRLAQVYVDKNIFLIIKKCLVLLKNSAKK